MINQTIVDAINSQIAKEMYSSNLYLSMAAYFYSINLNGFANWMKVQVQEETFHAMKFFDYVVSRGGEVKIAQIAEPQAKWSSVIDVFKATLEHEKAVTASINNLADLSLKENDHATSIMLQWFITEQIEEEASVEDTLRRLEMMGDFKGGLIMIDNELKSRVFVPPSK
ncbi:MAG TPA: ferritin [Candidatus Kapabacteria bacterium]|nr:ferritin [Candidatus Kapabacteria bacterium]